MLGERSQVSFNETGLPARSLLHSRWCSGGWLPCNPGAGEGGPCVLLRALQGTWLWSEGRGRLPGGSRRTWPPSSPGSSLPLLGPLRVLQVPRGCEEKNATRSMRASSWAQQGPERQDPPPETLGPCPRLSEGWESRALSCCGQDPWLCWMSLRHSPGSASPGLPSPQGMERNPGVSENSMGSSEMNPLQRQTNMPSDSSVFLPQTGCTP